MSLPTMTVRIAFATAPFAATPTWVDVTSDVLASEALVVKRGRQFELDRMEAGTCQFTLNNAAGNYWPDNAGGAYYGKVLPGKRVNVRAVYGAITYDIFTGFIESWDFGFRDRTKSPVARVTAVDLIKALSILNLNSAGYSQESSDTRVGNVLTALGWPAADRALNTGQSTIIASGALTNANARSHLTEVETSELGYIFIRGDGYVIFHDRHARYKAPYLTSQAVFGDDAGELDYHGVEFGYEDRLIYNDIRMTRSGGAEQAVSDSTSQTTYGTRALARTGLLMTTDGEALDQANWLLGRFKAPQLRLQSIIVLPAGNETTLYPEILGNDLGSRITVRLNEASVAADYHIEGVEHRIAENWWTTQYWLSNADSVKRWLLGETGYSELDSTTILGY